MLNSERKEPRRRVASVRKRGKFLKKIWGKKEDCTSERTKTGS